jgi:hypothetical protein
MEVQLIKLNKIKVNDKNPRTITEDKLRRFIESILVFPKMLTIRPIIIDDKGVALGGNMRTRALKEIKKLGRDAIPERLQQIRQYANKPQEEKNELLAHWDAWFKDETVPVIHAESLTEEEKREFIIKDNSSFGAWDWDVLANEWEPEQLEDWGVDVWQPQQYEGTASPDDVFNLPPELDGVDINPDDLPKIEGDDETAMERIIIVYPKEREEELAKLTGLDEIQKVVYNITELGL